MVHECNRFKWKHSSCTIYFISYDYYLAEIKTATDYSPFGCELKGRNLKKTGLNKSFRFGFQGQEGDDEIKGDGNSVNYKYRMHDPRLGRFFAVDPLSASYPYNSPYAFSENRVIDAIELEGLEKYLVTKSITRNKENTGYYVKTVLVFVKDSDRKESTPGANDKDRQVDYLVNGITLDIHNMPKGSWEDGAKDHKLKTYDNDGKNGKLRTLEEANSGSSGQELNKTKVEINGYGEKRVTEWLDESNNQTVKNVDIFYESNSYNNGGIDESLEVLNIAKIMILEPNLNLRIIGKTDREGDATKNMKLSTERAVKLKEQIVKEAVKLGADSATVSGRIETVGNGEKSAESAKKEDGVANSADRKTTVVVKM